MAGAGRDVDAVAHRGAGRLQHQVAAVAAGARVAEQQALGDDHRPLMPAPGLRARGVERVVPAALDPDVDDAAVVEAAAVDVTAVAGGLRHRQPPQLLAGAEGERPVRGDPRVVELVGVPAARAGQDDVPVVLARRVRIGVHGRTALDDVVELVRPHDIAGGRVDAAQVVVVAAGDDVRPAAVDHDARLPGPAAAGPVPGRVVLVLAGRPAAAQVDLPQHVQPLGRRAEPVGPAPIVAEEGADLDAVTGQARHGRLWHRLGGGGVRAPAAAPAGDCAPADEEDQGQQDERRDQAPPPELAAALGRAAPRRAPGCAVGRCDADTLLRRRPPRSPGGGIPAARQTGPGVGEPQSR